MNQRGNQRGTLGLGRPAIRRAPAGGVPGLELSDAVSVAPAANEKPPACCDGAPNENGVDDVAAGVDGPDAGWPNWKDDDAAGAAAGCPKANGAG